MNSPPVPPGTSSKTSGAGMACTAVVFISVDFDRAVVWHRLRMLLSTQERWPPRCWAPGQRPDDRGLMGIGQIKSLALYNISINMIGDLVAQSNKYNYVEPDDVSDAGEDI